MADSPNILTAFTRNFLGHSPDWYKLLILLFLVINPVVFVFDPFTAGWLLVAEFILTLAMALKCYPLQPGGLLALEAVIIGMTSPKTVYSEIAHNFPVILLLIFMVAGIYFMKDLLLFIFTKMLLRIRSKVMLSLAFCFAGAFLSAFLDALTVIAVVMSVATGFYAIYHRVASGRAQHADHDQNNDDDLPDLSRSDLDQFRAFLRSLMMHAAVGTALGGVCTLVGEPQNLIIGHVAGWNFIDFLIRVAPVSLPTLVAGLLTCALLEKSRRFGYGTQLPEHVGTILREFEAHEAANRTLRDKVNLCVQGLIIIWLVVALALHLAEVGIIGLSVIVLATAFTGITEEHSLGKAFHEALPFTALLTVFFVVVAVIADQKLFAPVTHWVLSFEGHGQLWRVFLANGLLSAVSDNVFVGTVYITEMMNALKEGIISRDQFDLLAVAVNTGTNLPSVATPNGQAAFLFLLTSALAPLIRLSYGRMVWMALPYTLVLIVVSLTAILFVLTPMTALFYDWGWIHHMTSMATEVPTSH